MCARGDAQARAMSRESQAVQPDEYTQGFVIFRGLKIKVDSRVLIPRKESELLVEEAIKLPPGRRVHEVGTGSGAVALAIASERPDLRVTASDISDAAVQCATENVEATGVVTVAPFTCPGLPPGIPEMGVDLIVANLPYLTDESMESRDATVQAEPRIATLGETPGSDGLGNIRALIEECSEKIPGVKIALEHDTHHAHEVRAMLVEAQTVRDHNGDERMTVGATR